MKKINVLSLLMLAASANFYASFTANPELAFALAGQAVNAFAEQVESDGDDLVAVNVIDFINKCVNRDKELKAELAASQNGYLFNGKPVDPAFLAAQNKKIQEDIAQNDASIHRLKRDKTVNHNNTLSPANKKKIERRKHDRDEKQKELKANMAALQANQAAQNAAEAQAEVINNLLEQNQIAVDQAIEYYVASFGQCYAKAGSLYGSTIIISSKYDKKDPITPREYNDFLAALNKAASQFGSNVSITIALNDGVEVSIKDVASYVSNITPTSYGTYMLVGGLLAAGATVGAMIINNQYQGRDWNDTAVYSQSAASTIQNAQDTYKTAAAKLQAQLPAVPASVSNVANDVSAKASNVSTGIVNYWNSLFASAPAEPNAPAYQDFTDANGVNYYANPNNAQGNYPAMIKGGQDYYTVQQDAPAKNFVGDNGVVYYATPNQMTGNTPAMVKGGQDYYADSGLYPWEKNNQ